MVRASCDTALSRASIHFANTPPDRSAYEPGSGWVRVRAFSEANHNASCDSRGGTARRDGSLSSVDGHRCARVGGVPCHRWRSRSGAIRGQITDRCVKLVRHPNPLCGRTRAVFLEQCKHDCVVLTGHDRSIALQRCEPRRGRRVPDDLIAGNQPLREMTTQTACVLDGLSAIAVSISSDPLAPPRPGVPSSLVM